MVESDDGAVPKISADEQVAQVFAWRRGFNAMHLIDLGVELGLFRAFADAPGSSAATVAQALGLHAPYVEIWCTTCHGFGLLDGDASGCFCLAPHLDSILASPGHPRYLGDYVRLGTEFAAADFRFCREAFRTGATAPFQGRSPAFASAVSSAIGGLHLLAVNKLIPSVPGLQERLRHGGKLLEIGCGTANFLIQFARAWPESQAIGVDIDPTGLAIGRKALAAAGLDERVQLREGDALAVVEPGSCDVVVMIEVLHEIAPALRQQVINSCARALRPGGWMVVIDETYPSTLEQARLPEFQFPLQTGFEEMVWGNVIPTREEQERLLHTAGFSGEINRQVIGEGFTVLSVQY